MVFLSYIFAGLAVCSLAYYAVCLLAADRFRNEAMPSVSINPPADLPPLSILKPLKGCDPEMYECLRSHCTQEYPKFEIIFGVNDVSDEAIPYIERLKKEFAHLPITLVVSQKVLGANRKVSNLVQMLPSAAYDHVLINDGDIRVPPNYLRDVMSGFATPGEKSVGMVTCLYRGVAGKTLWSKLEGFGINVDFMAGVLVAKYIDGEVRFALGSTLCTNKQAIAAMGGLNALVDHLADDYELGKRISESGYRVVVSHAVVETLLPEYEYVAFMDHQLRWGRTVRNSRPGGYFGMAVTFGMIWALLAVIASFGAMWSWMLLVTVLAAKFAVAVQVSKKIIGDDEFNRNVWLLPLRELVTPMIWLRSIVGNKIVWRGETFTLRDDGKLVR